MNCSFATRCDLVAAFDAVDAGLVMYDAQDRLVLCNRKYLELYPHSADLMVPGRSYEEIVRAMAARPSARHASGQSEEDWIAEQLAVHANPGDPSEQESNGRWIRVSTRRTEAGALVSVYTDISSLKTAHEELRRAKEAAEAAARAKGEFLATMSHEIRTPMNGVIGMTTLLADTPLAPQQQDYLHTIRTSGEALLTIINDILDYSKLEAGQVELEQLPFDLREVVEGAVTLLAEKAQAKGLELVGHVALGVPPIVIGDPGRLRQLLLNLAGNAVKFTERGEVEVHVEAFATAARHTVGLRLAVRDTGVGISREALARLFRPFSQADGSTARRFGGTGLGLAITRRIIERLGGHITVYSREGEGSEFDVTFLLAAPPARQGDEAARRPPRLDGRRVLCVDDNAAARRVLRETLGACGALVDEACDGDEALRRIEEARRRYDLALVDSRMPGAPPTALLDAIDASSFLRGVPVVLLTELSERGLPQDARFARTIRKPLRREQLYDGVLSALGMAPRARADARALEEVAGPAPRRCRALVAEDNAVNQRLVVALLRKLSCEADLAGNGAEAIEAVARQAYDVVFMDCQMPEVDGFEASRAIREREAAAGRRTPIIALTANAMEGDRERCLAAGMDDYLAKPVRPEDLRRALLRHVPQEV